ncbi:YopR/YscH family type III secretion effector [Pseudomonas aeruginosa]
MSRIDTPPGFAVYPSASPKAANLPAVDQVLAFEQALGGEYLAQLARRELQVLIPLNGMLDNLVRNSHKLDLES